jgi:hypothetical protein
MNHRDTEKGLLNLFIAAFLCVFVSLWFIIRRYAFLYLVFGTSLEFFSFYQS